MTRYTFRSDRTFEGSFTTWFIYVSGGGTYLVQGERLTLQTQNKTNTARFYFDGDRMIIEEGSDTFRLHRIGN